MGTRGSIKISAQDDQTKKCLSAQQIPQIPSEYSPKVQGRSFALFLSTLDLGDKNSSIFGEDFFAFFFLVFN